MKNGLEQSGNKFCSMCGAIDGDFWQTEPFRACQLKSNPRDGDVMQNWMLCDECYEGLQNTALPKPDQIYLLAQIRGRQ